MWAVGVLFFTLVFGRYPFYVTSTSTTEGVTGNAFSLPLSYRPLLSSSGWEFLSQMLCVDLAKRPDAVTLLRCPLLSSVKMELSDEDEDM